LMDDASIHALSHQEAKRMHCLLLCHIDILWVNEQTTR